MLAVYCLEAEGAEQCQSWTEALVSNKVKDDKPFSRGKHILMGACPVHLPRCQKDTRFPNPAEHREEAIILKKGYFSSNPFSQLVYHLQSLR